VKGGGDKKRKKFPNPQFGSFSEPLTVVDSKGRIILWYLPGLLSKKEKVILSVLLAMKRANRFKSEWNSSRHSQHSTLVKEIS